MTDLNIQDRIDQYILGMMSSEERSAFEEEMENNADLKSEVELQKRICSQIEDLADKRRKMAYWDKDFSVSSNGAGPKSFSWRNIYVISSVAAVLIVGIFFSIFHNSDHSDSRVSPTPLEQPVMRGALSIDSIQVLIDSADYDSALEAIEKLRADTLDDTRSTDPEEIEYFRLVRRDIERQLDSLERVCRGRK